MLTPLFREIKKQFIHATIDFLTSNTFASVCGNNPHISSTIAFDRNKEASEFQRVVSLVRANNYDLIIDAHNSIRSRVLLMKLHGLLYWLKAKITTIDKRSWKRNLLLSVKINLLRNAVSQREAYCRLLPNIQESARLDCSTELYPSTQDRKRVKTILHEFNVEGKVVVAIGPGASFAGKCWPKEKYLELVTRFHQLGVAVVILGGKDDSEPFWIEARSDVPILNTAGKLSFLETAAMLSECKFTVSNDSAIVHFAEAMGIPSIAIFGPTAKEFGYAPFLPESQLLDLSLPCRPCSRNGKGACQNPFVRQCLTDISLESVFNAATKLMKN